MKRLCTYMKTTTSSYFDNNPEAGFWIVAVKVENERLYIMVTDGDNTWYPRGPIHDADRLILNEEPGIFDNAEAIDRAGELGWTCYVCEDDGEMYDMADLIRDVYQNAILL